MNSESVTASNRRYSGIDRHLIAFNNFLSTVAAAPKPSRPYPAKTRDSDQLSESTKTESSRYMRINHVGEICAQALYQAQGLTARHPQTRKKMQAAAQEEIDHLAWCEQRLFELGGRKSWLNPIWYTGSFGIGYAAGLAGDKWNLGFLAETERQVVDHLERHLGELPEEDQRSREVIRQMQIDENQHAEDAVAHGAAELPQPAKAMMRLASRIMTTASRFI